MEEEHKQELTAPPRFRKLYKILTLTVLFLAIFFFAGFFGLEATSSSKFCSSCHEMKPEYYTWKASTHSEVDCVNCHIQPGAKNVAKSKAGGVIELYKQKTKTYTAPIRMPNEIPNSSCEKCHNMETREVTTSGDLIIPHDKHLNKDIKCIQCHSGVAHGKIAERKVTYQTDYNKWDAALGRSMMSDVKFTSPKMEKCINCHKARDITIECKACHTTGMFPKTHKQQTFKWGSHGQYAKQDIAKCNSCHKYMSKDEIKDFLDIPAYKQFLTHGKVEQKVISAQEYVKENSFCKDCHSKRPPSHIQGFMKLHGPLANKGKEKCLACHDVQKTGKSATSNVTCSSCHPASHKQTWRDNHPVQLPANQKPEQVCYTCHYKPTCSACHRE